MAGKQKHLNFIDWNDFLAGQRENPLPLLDVRTPMEFLQGQVPGAHNVPVLTDDDRHQVGLTYKTVSKKDAVALGIELFATRVESFSKMIETKCDGSSRVALSCFRGGMRSQFSGMWASALGIQPFVMKGGYKAFRKHALNAINELTLRKIYVLDGRTGAGKTDLLKCLPASVAMIDLEGLAHHRGSAFGDFAQAEPCPTQQNFENNLAEKIWALPAGVPVIIEIENFIGPIKLPHLLRQILTVSPVIHVERDMDDRVARLAREYASTWDEKSDQLFTERCELLIRHLSRSQINDLIESVKCRDFPTVVRALLNLRYDRVYDRGIQRRQVNEIARFNLTHEENRAIEFIKNLT